MASFFDCFSGLRIGFFLFEDSRNRPYFILFSIQCLQFKKVFLSDRTKWKRFFLLDLTSLIFNEDKSNKFTFKFYSNSKKKKKEKTRRLKKSSQKCSISRKLRLNPPRSKWTPNSFYIERVRCIGTRGGQVETGMAVSTAAAFININDAFPHCERRGAVNKTQNNAGRNVTTSYSSPVAILDPFRGPSSARR